MNKAEEIIAKYQNYIDNIKWDIKTNERPTDVVERSEARIKCYQEIIDDLRASATHPKEGSAGVWRKDKPDFECVFLSRNKYIRNNETLYYDYTVWQTKYLQGEDEQGNAGFYLALLNGEGEEWGALEDMKAQEYLIISQSSASPTADGMEVGWISVEDDLPDYYKTVQVYDEQVGVCQAWRANNGDNDIWTVHRSDIVLSNPTHWQPLPDPPTTH